MSGLTKNDFPLKRSHKGEAQEDDDDDCIIIETQDHVSSKKFCNEPPSNVNNYWRPYPSHAAPPPPFFNSPNLSHPWYSGMSHRYSSPSQSLLVPSKSPAANVNTRRNEISSSSVSTSPANTKRKKIVKSPDVACDKNRRKLGRISRPVPPAIRLPLVPIPRYPNGPVKLESPSSTSAAETSILSDNSQYWETIYNPRETIIQKTEDNRVKMTILLPNKMKRFVEFNTGGENCTVHDLLEKAQVATFLSTPILLEKNPKVNYIVDFRQPTKLKTVDNYSGNNFEKVKSILEIFSDEKQSEIFPDLGEVIYISSDEDEGTREIIKNKGKNIVGGVEEELLNNKETEVTISEGNLIQEKIVDHLDAQTSVELPDDQVVVPDNLLGEKNTLSEFTDAEILNCLRRDEEDSLMTNNEGATPGQVEDDCLGDVIHEEVVDHVDVQKVTEKLLDHDYAKTYSPSESGTTTLPDDDQAIFSEDLLSEENLPSELSETESLDFLFRGENPLITGVPEHVEDDCIDGLIHEEVVDHLDVQEDNDKVPELGNIETELIPQIKKIKFTCHYIKIGSHIYKPKRDISFGQSGLNLNQVPVLDREKISVEIHVNFKDMIRVEADFSEKISTMLVYTNPVEGKIIRDILGIMDEKDLDNNPVGRENEEMPIMLLAGKLADNQVIDLKNLLKKNNLLAELKEAEIFGFLLRGEDPLMAGGNTSGLGDDVAREDSVEKIDKTKENFLEDRGNFIENENVNRKKGNINDEKKKEAVNDGKKLVTVRKIKEILPQIFNQQNNKHNLNKDKSPLFIIENGSIIVYKPIKILQPIKLQGEGNSGNICNLYVEQFNKTITIQKVPKQIMRNIRVVRPMSG